MHSLDSTSRLALPDETLRRDLLQESRIAIAADLHADIVAWLAGHLEWTPAALSRPAPQLDQIDRVMADIAAGHLVPITEGDLACWEDALDLEMVRCMAHFMGGFCSDTNLDRVVADIEDNSSFPKSPAYTPGDLTLATIAALRARLAVAHHWSEQLAASTEGALLAHEMNRYWAARQAELDARRAEENARYVVAAERIIAQHQHGQDAQ